MTEKKSRFLSWRLLVFGLILTSAFFLLAAVAAFAAGSGQMLIFAVCAGELIFCAAFFYFFIHRPWREIELLFTRIGEGFFPEEDPGFTADMELSPGFLKMMEKIYHLRHSQQYHMMNRRQIQYLALQNQINPHFLYNTLDGIRSEALLDGAKTVAEMSEALATFFRYTISKVENLVTVEEEIENCETYFKIQQFRFGDRLKLEIVRDEEWDRLSHCLIPKLTLQPILENSIIHGTELKLGEGVSKIIVQRSGKLLLVRVSDNGIGMNEETLMKLNSRLNTDPEVDSTEGEGSIALANVSNRIHLIFGEDYNLHVYSIENQGTDVDITLPVVYSEKELAGLRAVS